MFLCLRDLISQLCANLPNKKKEVANIADQLSLQYVMSILGTNLSALGFCKINLTDILEEHEYKIFLEMYNKCIISLIEKGYSEDF
jgi:hypothetical protein